jgi:hypothetical protein
MVGQKAASAVHPIVFQNTPARSSVNKFTEYASKRKNRVKYFIDRLQLLDIQEFLDPFLMSIPLLE